MKRMIAALAAVMLAVTPMTGCRKERINDKPTADSVSDEERISEDCQKAYRQMFAANYAYDGGEVCYEYMFPKIVVNELRRSGRYDDLISTFNDSQRMFVQNIQNIPQINEITEQKELTDSQLTAASNYFVKSAAEFVSVGLDPAGINITSGYELRSSITDQNGNADTDTECLVYIEDDGWKVISMSAEKLEARYKE